MVFKQSRSDQTGQRQARYLNLITVVEAEPGSFSITGDAFGKLQSQIFRSGDSADLTFTTSNLIRIRNQLGEVYSRVSDATGIPESVLRNAATAQVPDELQSINSQSLDILTVPVTAGNDEEQGSGQERISYEREITYPAPVIFLPQEQAERAEDILEGLPPLRLVVTLKSKSTLQNTLGGQAQNTFEVPADEIFDIRDISEIPCANLFPQVEERVTELQSNVESRAPRIQRDINTIGDVTDQIASAVPVTLSDDEALPEIESIEEEELLGSDVSREDITQWRQEIQNIQDPNVAGIKGDLNGLRDLSDNLNNRVGLQRCVENFSSTIESALNTGESQLERARLILDRKNRLLDILSGLDVPECAQEFADTFQPVGDVESRAEDAIQEFRQQVGSDLSNIDPDNVDVGELGFRPSELRQELLTDLDTLERTGSRVLGGTPCIGQFRTRINQARSTVKRIPTAGEGGFSDCSDVPRRLRNQARRYGDEVQNFFQLAPRRQTVDRSESLVNEGESLQQEIRDNVGEANPCRDELLSEIEGPLSELQAFSPDRGALPCSQQFSSLDDRISDFESSVAGLGGSPSARRVSSLTTDADGLISDIRSATSDSQECRQEFISRVRSAVDSLERRSQPAELRIDVDREVVNERRQQLQQLQSQLEGITLTELPDDFQSGD